MESVLAAFIIIFVILFGVLTLSGAFLSNQDAIRVTWLEMEERLADQSRTSLTAVQTSIEDSGTTVKVTLRNDGLTKLADFQQWDMILHYFDDGEPSVYHINWMPYADNMPAANDWTVNGCLIDAGEEVNAAYEPE
ncbi:MAG: hypothetical protein GYB66_13715, partial [Chloroflexi bacterium]|nr:hypothetical protein [Chloroflexota bacterium]